MIKTLTIDTIIGLVIYGAYKSFIAGLNPVVGLFLAILIGGVLIPLLVKSLKDIWKTQKLKMKVVQGALLTLAVLIPILLISLQLRPSDPSQQSKRYQINE